MHPSSEGLFAGRFRIESKLGEGAYGKVYAATQVDLGRRVALKVLHPDVVLRESAVERFLREAQVVQSLSHPHVVRLFDHGRTSDGLPFIVYELLEGRSLEDTLARSGPLRADRAAWIGVQMLRGLLEAHARGVVHRDIKPANVFLCDYPGETDFVKIVDFGVAAIANQSGPVLTREGTSIGTPAYMAPEQMLGASIDGRSDVYAVGLVLAEMVTGRRVFSGESAIAVGLEQISDAPVPLDEGLRSSVLGRLIARAVEKDVARRFSARDLLAALEAVVDNRSYSLPPLPPRPPGRGRPRSSGWIVPLVVLLSITGLGFAGLAVWLGLDGPRGRTSTNREKTRSEDPSDEEDHDAETTESSEPDPVEIDPVEIFGAIEKREFRGVAVNEVRRRVLAGGWVLGSQNVIASTATLKIYSMNFDRNGQSLGVIVSCKSGDEPSGKTTADGCFKAENCIESGPCTLRVVHGIGAQAADASSEFQRVFAVQP